MSMPKKISTWCLVLFFLLTGLAAFGVTLGELNETIVGVLALAAAVTLFMDK